jgi:hypothetical protein
MVKIICDKSIRKLTFIVLGIIANLMIFVILMAIFSYTFNLLNSIITLLVVLTCTILILLGYYKSLQKSKNFVIIENGVMKYDYHSNLIIPLSQIQKVESDNLDGSLLNRIIIIYNYSGVKTSIPISKSMIKKLSNAIKIPIEFVGKRIGKRVFISIKNSWKQWKNLFFSEKYKILATLIGTMISIGSIILYSNYKSLWSNLLLSMICLIYSVIQAYKLYFKDKSWDIPSKIILSIMFFSVFTSIIFVIITVCSMAVLKFPFSLNYIMYAIFVTPAFLLVIIIVLFLLSALQYA